MTSKLIERDPEPTLNFPCTQRPDSRNPNQMTIFMKSSLDQSCAEKYYNTTIHHCVTPPPLFSCSNFKFNDLQSLQSLQSLEIQEYYQPTACQVFLVIFCCNISQFQYQLALTVRAHYKVFHNKPIHSFATMCCPKQT